MQAVNWLVSPLLTAVGILKPPKPQVQPSLAQPQPLQRDDGREAALKQDELLRRRGGAADMVTGANGAPAPAGGKTTLGT